MKHTGFGLAAAAAIKGRGAGMCNGCYRRHAIHMHHRDPRGMGGSSKKEINSPANGLHLCLRCHDWAESNRKCAEQLGWLVVANEQSDEKPVWLVLPYGAGWYRLPHDGTVVWQHGMESPDPRCMPVAA